MASADRPGPARPRRSGRRVPSFGACQGLARLVFAISALSASSAFGGTPRPPEALSWPLDARPRLTSTFCEPRGLRFHAGVDMSTGGRVGLDLRSPVDGEIVRVASSFYGYGKQLLLEDASGRRYLFGHMLDFRADVEAELLARQLRQGRYETTWYPDAGRFPVRKGELVGRSGDSGSGPPHVHFEIREGEEPVNPLQFGLPIADSRPPELPFVALLPVAPGSRVEGSLLPAVRRAVRQSAGLWTLPDTLQVDGPIALAAIAIDRVDEGEARLAPAALRLIVDGDTLLEQRHERLRFEWNRQSALVYEGWLRELEPFGRKDSWFRLQRPDSDLPFWRDGDDGRLDPAGWPSGSARVRIEAEDAAGLVGALEFVLRRGQGGGGNGLNAREALAWTAGEALHLEWPARRDNLRLSLDSGTRPVTPLELVGSRSGLVIEGEAVKSGRLRLQGFPDEVVLDGAWVVAGAEARLAEAGGARLELAAGALRRGTRLVFARDGAVPALPKTLEAENGSALRDEAPLLRLGPADLALQKDAVLRLPCRLDSASATRAGLVRVDSEGLSWQGGRVEDDTLRASVSRGGLYALLVDDRPPEPRWTRGQRPGRARRPVLVWQVTERLSGVSHAELFVDGALALPRYDPDTGRLLWKPDADLAPGTHDLQLRIEDRAGNNGDWRNELRILP